jgi:hypothetical protein
MNKTFLSIIFLSSFLSTNIYAGNCYGEKQSKCNQEDAAKILVAAGLAVVVVRAMNKNDKANINNIHNTYLPIKDSNFVINFDNPTNQNFNNFNAANSYIQNTPYLNINLKYNFN